MFIPSPMPTMTLSEALEESIIHWERNIRVVKFSDAKIYESDCALCTLFVNSNVYDEKGLMRPCIGCPVYKKTGYSECVNSPWVVVSAVYQRWRLGQWDDAEKIRLEFIAAAQAQLAFLISLRDTVKTMSVVSPSA